MGAAPFRSLLGAALAAALALFLVGCQAQPQDGTGKSTGSEASGTSGVETGEEATSMQIEVNGATFTATFEDTEAAREFQALLPLTLEATELNGNEKYARLDESLSTDGAGVVSPIEAGDVMLYESDMVVLFYGTHDNSQWSYVPIAHIDDASGLAEAVGSGDVTITYAVTSSSDRQNNASNPMATQAPAASDGSYETSNLWVDEDGQRIYGEAYVPEGTGPFPLVILSHGFGGSHDDLASYAQALAENGYAAYVFDFRGGSAGGNQSDGDPLEMSVETEAADLEAVLTAAGGWDFVEQGHVSLAGASQGGMVSALVAARHPDEVRSLILFYPALSIVDDVHDAFAAESDVPDTYQPLGAWMTVGSRYATDVWDLDVYGTIAGYEGPVLIVHGDADRIVDVSYSERAAETYDNCTLDVIPGAGHGFSGEAYERSLDDALEFLRENA